MTFGARTPVFQPIAERVRVHRQVVSSLTSADAALDLTTFTQSFADNSTNGTDGTPQTLTVPEGITWMVFNGFGSQGAGVFRGQGHWFVARVPVNEGEVLEVRVGGCPAFLVAGGYNGGGVSEQADHGGGGATDVRRQPYGLADRIYVAGGGGGGGTVNGNGGSGGYVVGRAGTRPTGGSGGDGGSQSAGGAGSIDGGFAGGFGAGGGPELTTGAGAGGGGWYGGGGGGNDGSGHDSGGGGGSSYVHPSGLAIWGSRGLTFTSGSLTVYGFVGP